MKTYLFAILLVLFVSSAAFAGEDYTNLIYRCEQPGCAELLQEIKILPNYQQDVKDLAAKGEICKVYGHWWGEDHYLCFSADGSSCAVQRKCRLCEKIETKQPEAWR